MRKLFINICKHCGRQFNTYESDKEYCSLPCQIEDKEKDEVIPENKHRKSKRILHYTISVKKCRCCQKDFQPNTNRQIYCDYCGPRVRLAVSRMMENNKRGSGGMYEYKTKPYKDYDPMVEDFVRNRWVSSKRRTKSVTHG